MIKRKTNKLKGFTLVEVILVVSIITILSTIVVPQVGKHLNNANKSKLIGAVTQLNNSILTWSLDNGGNNPNTLNEVFEEFGDISKLNIGLNEDGSFKIGNIHGNIYLEDGVIIAKISDDSKSFASEIISR